jgi:hypothetical protein
MIDSARNLNHQRRSVKRTVERSEKYYVSSSLSADDLLAAGTAQPTKGAVASPAIERAVKTPQGKVLPSSLLNTPPMLPSRQDAFPSTFSLGAGTPKATNSVSAALIDLGAAAGAIDRIVHEIYTSLYGNPPASSNKGSGLPWDDDDDDSEDESISATDKKFALLPRVNVDWIRRVIASRFQFVVIDDSFDSTFFSDSRTSPARLRAAPVVPPSLSFASIVPFLPLALPQLETDIGLDSDGASAIPPPPELVRVVSLEREGKVVVPLYRKMSTSRAPGVSCSVDFSPHRPSSIGGVRDPDTVLLKYVPPILIKDMIKSMCHDDVRVTSFNTQFLKAVYVSCHSFRLLIADSLKEACRNRVERAKMHESLRSNSVLSRLLLNSDGLVTVNSFIGPESANNNPRDHLNSVVDLLECMCQVNLSGFTDKHKIYEAIGASIVSCTKCMGSGLGMGASADGIYDQPHVLKKIVSCTELLLDTAKDVRSTVLTMMRDLLKSWPSKSDFAADSSRMQVPFKPICTNTIREEAYISVIARLLIQDSCVSAYYRCHGPPCQHAKVVDDRELIARLESPDDTILNRTVFKIVLGVESPHFKVALKCIELIDAFPVLLDSYFLPTDDTISSCLLLDEARDKKSKRLDQLVNGLRRNRKHWSVKVRELSQELLDKLLDSML